MALRRAIGGLWCLLAAFQATPAGAADAPLGTYLASCRDVVLQGSTLIAICSAPGGYWVAARLEDYPFCVGDIVNQNGKLFCMRMSSVLGVETPAGRAAVGPPPVGSYMGSCRDIRLDDGWLKATCLDQAGRWRQASIVANWCALFGKDIANLEGELTCR